jgi:undecaprenyl-diphosphatase
MALLLQLNYTLFQLINGQAETQPWLDRWMVFCANYLIFFFPLLLILMWGRPMKWRSQPLTAGEQIVLDERRAVVLWTAVACVGAYALNLLIEQFVFEPRPFINHHVHLLIRHVADGSFPSDHTAWSLAVGGLFLFMLWPAWQQARRQRATLGDSTLLRAVIYPGLLTLLALVMGCLIGFARIFTGVHYPGDILGGAIDGLIAASLITFLRLALSRPTNAVIRFAGNLHLA